MEIQQLLFVIYFILEKKFNLVELFILQICEFQGFEHKYHHDAFPQMIILVLHPAASDLK
jgi:hypothetical protein